MPELSFETTTDCGGTTINFNNTSLFALEFEWDFGDSTTSTEASPSHTYNDMGTYTVTLRVADGQLCRDSITQEITIEEALLNAAFSVDYENCSEDSVQLQFNDLSTNNLNNTVSWFWTFSNGETSDEREPLLSLTTDQTLEATLLITTEEGCTNSMTETYEIDILDDINTPDQVQICEGSSTSLGLTANPNYTYSWSPVEGIDDPTSADPTFNPSQTTIYTLAVTSIGIDTCEIVRTVEILVTPEIDLQVSGDTSTCEGSTTLTASAAVDGTFVWTNSSGDTIQTDNPQLTIPVSGSTTYQVEFTSLDNCVETQTLTVSGGTVDVALPDQVAVCLGEELAINVTNLDASDVLTYDWTPMNAFESGTANSATPDFIETVGEQMVYVTITNQAGCTYQDSVLAVVVDPNISLSFSSELECNGATVNFTNTSTDAFGYIWNFGDGNTSTEENPIHTYTTEGTYDVTLSIIYDVSCVEDTSQTVEILDPQIIADFTQDIMDCQADSTEVAFFDASINSFNNTESWSWTFSNGATSNEQNPMITISESGELLVTLTIVSANNCEASVTDTLNFELINLDLPDTLIICEGDSTQLNPAANMDYSYSWTNGSTLDDANAANPTAFPTETTTYTVTVMSFGSDTCVISTDVTVQVAPAIELAVSDDVITCGEDATLTATNSSAADVDISWVNSAGEAVGTGSEITVNPFTTETYTATASDSFGCSETQSVLVTDNGVDVEAPDDIMSCESQELLLSINNLDTADILTHNWSPASNIISDPLQAEVTVIVESGTVTFMDAITNQHGCTENVVVNVTAVPFSIDMPSDVAVCFGEPVGLSPDANPDYSYEWSPAEGLDDANSSNPIFIGSSDQTYSVTITDDSNGVACMTTREVAVDVSEPIELQASGDTTLCEILDVTLMASSSQAGIQLEWSDSNGSIGTGSPITVTPVEGQNIYTVLATDTTNCVDTATVVVTVGLIETGIQDLIEACENIETELNPDGNPDLIYTWSPSENLDLTEPWNPIASTDMDQTYSVTITSADGSCVIEETTTLDIYEAINLNVSGGGVACDSSTISFTASTDIATTINWSDASGMGIFEGEDFTTVVTGSTFFTVTAEDENGCMETETVAVDDERVDAVITPDGILCVPITDYLIEVTNLNPDHELTYSWDPDISSGPSILITPEINATQTYTVEVTNQFGCSTTLSSSVQVIVLDELLSISANPDTIRLGESSELTVTGCDECEYSWDWPSGTIDDPSASSVIVAPDELFSNFYTVMVSNMEGCATELNVEVFLRDALCDEPHIFLPNAFSPNNDGENDELRVRASFVESLELLIYNRWGEKMITIESLDQSWDGTYRGEQLPPDVYGYHLIVNCPNGEVFTKKGSITLLR